MKYSLQNLAEINTRFCRSYSLHDSDVSMANDYVTFIENTRRKTPCIGDIVEFTTEYGDYYSSAHIDTLTEDEAYICERPYVPFINKNEEKTGINCCTSGGTWCFIPLAKLSWVGKRQKRFCDWGHCGPRGDGAVEFEAEVNVWRYTAANRYISKNGFPFTTKDFRKMHISYIPVSRRRGNLQAAYECFGKQAWKTERELQAWLRTYRAELFPRGDYSVTVWYWKEEEHSVSPTEFEALDLPEDTMMKNATVLRCKRKYDEENHTIHTYFVWYWKEPGKDFYTMTSEQNEIRKKHYELGNWTVPVNQFALDEFASGKIIPEDISFLKKMEKEIEK